MGNLMIDEDASAVSGRKKIYGLLPRQGRMIIQFLAERGGVWKESQIMSHVREHWGRDGVDRGKITFFCRCVKDQTGSTSFPYRAIAHEISNTDLLKVVESNSLFFKQVNTCKGSDSVP